MGLSSFKLKSIKIETNHVYRTPWEFSCSLRVELEGTTCLTTNLLEWPISLMHAEVHLQPKLSSRPEQLYLLMSSCRPFNSHRFPATYSAKTLL